MQKVFSRKKFITFKEKNSLKLGRRILFYFSSCDVNFNCEFQKQINENYLGDIFQRIKSNKLLIVNRYCRNQNRSYESKVSQRHDDISRYFQCYCVNSNVTSDVETKQTVERSKINFLPKHRRQHFCEESSTKTFPKEQSRPRNLSRLGTFFLLLPFKNNRSHKCLVCFVVPPAGCLNSFSIRRRRERCRANNIQNRLESSCVV